MIGEFEFGLKKCIYIRGICKYLDTEVMVEM